MRGSNTSWIDMRDFDTTLTQVMPVVSQNEKQLLELKYQMPGDPNAFNVMQFMQDLYQMAMQTGGDSSRIMSLNDNEKKLYQHLNNALEAGEAKVKFVINLKHQDPASNGYLNEAMIIQAFQNTFQQMKQQARVPRLNEYQIRELLRPINKNTAGFFSYREILIHTFGESIGQKYFLMDKQQLETEGSSAMAGQDNAFNMPRETVGAANNIMDSIGKKMIQSRTNYEDEFKRVLGPNSDMKAS